MQDPAERFLANQFLLAYLPGKGKQFVPILIPKDICPAIELLMTHRTEYGICTNNPFVFPTKASTNHCSGWHAVYAITHLVPVNLNATLNRHRISTLYASMDMSPADSKIYFEHISHSANVSVENYRCPPGLRETVVMGRLLTEVDEGNFFFI